MSFPWLQFRVSTTLLHTQCGTDDDRHGISPYRLKPSSKLKGPQALKRFGKPGPSLPRRLSASKSDFIQVKVVKFKSKRSQVVVILLMA